ncbi:MAG: penicillin-binding transpeptidase domain-containing protein [Peptococcaceae bacterium]|nr:penicillin-binding transpeptidase domain-containing protein [Peptococcaceae bacterium]
MRRRKRLFFTGVLAGMAGLALVGRLAWIQLAMGPQLAAAALAQVSRSVPLEAVPRGGILDDNLVPLTGEYRADRLVVFPDLVAHPVADAAVLAPLLKVDPEVLARDLAGAPHVLTYPVDRSVRQAVGGLNDPGLKVDRVTYRDGPDALAVHLTGYLGPPENQAEAAGVAPGGDLVGLSGLERYYNQDLEDGTARRYAREFIDADGRPLGVVDTRDADPGRRNVVLTIDSGVQATVERIMDKDVPKGAVVVLDAATGDVLAMASRPTFQPDRVGDYLGSPAAGNVFVNRALALYPPGSVFKIAVAAAALNEGVATPHTLFFDRGARATPVPDWYKPGFGLIDFNHAFAESVNPFFAKLGLELGAGRLIGYAERFGLADQSPAGYRVPADARQNWSLVAAPDNLVNSSIGQGPVLVSPLQVAAMTEAVVNKGVYVQPRLVKAVVRDDGRVVETPARVPASRVIGLPADRELLAMMRLVTTSGTGRDADVPGWGSAGKTGTAQTGTEGTPDDAWFAGFAPWPNARYVAVVLVQGGTDGGVDAGSVFRLLMESLLNGKEGAKLLTQ